MESEVKPLSLQLPLFAELAWQRWCLFGDETTGEVGELPSGKSFGMWTVDCGLGWEDYSSSSRAPVAFLVGLNVKYLVHILTLFINIYQHSHQSSVRIHSQQAYYTYLPYT